MPDKAKFGDAFIKDFFSLFDEHSIRNPAYARMVLHVILGQALKNIYFRQGARRIDIRLHLLLIRPSGAGKGAGYGFFCKLAADLGLDNQKLTEATDAGLAGSGSVNPKTNEVEVNHGLMEDADFISMEEGSTLFDFASSFSKKNLTYLQVAMNPLDDESCEISKKIGSLPEAIRFKPHCSFLILTYIPEKFIDALVTRGVIQRFVPIMQTVSLDERLKVVDIAIDKLNTSTEGDFDDKYKKVLIRLKYIISKYQKYGTPEETKKYEVNREDLKRAFIKSVNRKVSNDVLEKLINHTEQEVNKLNQRDWNGYCFDISDISKDAIRKVEHEFVKMMKDTSQYAQQKLQEFTHRIYELLVRFAIHHAILDLRTSVEMQDVIYARRVLMPIWKNVIYNLEDLLIMDVSQRVKYHGMVHWAVNAYKNILAQNDEKFVRKDNVGTVWVRRGKLLKDLQPRWDNCSFVTANNRLSKLETENPNDDDKHKWFLRRNWGTTAFVKLIQDVR